MSCPIACLILCVSWFFAASLALLLGRRPPVSVLTMDNILRELEGLSRPELVWLNTYLAGRLRALPSASVMARTAWEKKKEALPPASVQIGTQPEVATAASSTTLGGTFFFLLEAWLNEIRCPGGRPSVS